MKNLHIISIALSLLLLGCSKINDRLDNLEQAVDEIQNKQIASVQEQISSINETLEELENTDSDLKDYIIALQNRATELEKGIASINDEMDEMKKTLEDKLSDEISQILLLLETTKNDIQSDLSSINALIVELQDKDKDLENQISTLRDYVNNELKDTEDWATATFATMEQYNYLAELVASINAKTESINGILSDLEERIEKNLNDTIDEKLKNIKENIDASIDSDIANAISGIANDYKNAISTATTDITTAYKASIKEAIDNLEASIKAWVNTQLANYYTIAEADAKLEALKNTLESKIIASENSLKAYISELESEINSKITANSNLIVTLQSSITTLSGDAAKNASNIIINTNAIEANASSIRQNVQSLLANTADIAANSALIAENKTLILKNDTLIKQNQASILALQNQVNANEQNIIANATLIAKNATDISNNATLIANNAASITNNLAAITANSLEISNLRAELIEAKKEITQAYTNAIATAISKLDGELRDKIAEEVATINATIEALAARVTAIEKEIKNIKVSIYNIQNDISVLQEQVAEILARIQSISYVPKYSDGNATMYYTNSAGVITAGTAILDFEIHPANVASEIISVWHSALCAKAVYTLTRAAGDFVNLTIQSATEKNGILTIELSGAALDEAFFRSEISANVRLEISDGNNQLASEYINMVPWTTDNIYIPDANFKTVLLASYDINNDGEISSEEAEMVTSLDVSATIPQITSLEGIEYFTNLTTLDCSYNRITSLDLSNNTKLTTLNAGTNLLQSAILPSTITLLDLSNNKLATVDVSKMKGLSTLNVANNKLASLNVGQNTTLTQLLCLNNSLVSLDVTKLRLLEELNCSNNQISQLNLTNNTALISLNVSKNNLTTLDVTKCVDLKELDCSKNSLAKLYITGLSQLTTLDCSENTLTRLDLLGCSILNNLNCSDNTLSTLNLVLVTKLQTLDCSYNNLLMLDISSNLSLTSLKCTDNINLAKLWVKNDSQLNSVSITKEETTLIYYNNGGINIPDVALKSYLVNNYDDDGDGEISIAEADNITMVNCSGKGVVDLTGLESCSNLMSINCSNNNITTIELPNLAKLKTITCNGCPIEKLNFDRCTSLQYLNLQGVTSNAITGNAIYINNYTQATTFDISVKGTPFTSFSFVNDIDLTSIVFDGEFTNVNLFGNSILENINVSLLYDLEILDVQNCKLQSLDVTKNVALTSLVCNNNELTTLNVSNNTLLEKFYCNNNQLSKINVTSNTQLKELNLSDNMLSALNLRNNTALVSLYISNNADISIVNLKENKALQTLYAQGLSIGDIDLSSNNALQDVNLYDNASLKTIIIWDECTTRNDYLHFDMGGVEVYDNAGNSYGYPYSVGQYIPWFNGGVIYEITNDRQNGKMVSVTETKLQWSTTLTKTSASNYDNGALNIAVIKSISSWETKYPAFKWCNDYGTGWYLPAINELKTIYNSVLTINSTLSTNKFNEFTTFYFSGSFYLSSTESYNNSTDNAYYINFNDGNSSYVISKTSNEKIRAIYAF